MNQTEKAVHFAALPVNVMIMDGVPSIDRLTERGVSRISCGPIPYIRAMDALKQDHARFVPGLVSKHGMETRPTPRELPCRPGRARSKIPAGQGRTWLPSAACAYVRRLSDGPRSTGLGKLLYGKSLSGFGLPTVGEVKSTAKTGIHLPDGVPECISQVKKSVCG